MNRLTHCLLAGLVFFLSGPVSPLSAQPQSAAAPVVQIGSLFVDDQLAGSCFYVDKHGIVATSFSNVWQGNNAWVQFPNGDRFRVLGFVAAAKGKDIVLLKIAKNGKNFLDEVALQLDPNADPKMDAELLLGGGPQSQPIAGNYVYPKVNRRLLGQEYLLGLSRIPSTEIGRDPNTRWIWSSISRHISCNGGPVFDQRGKVVGMLSAALEPASIVYSAVHIEHVVSLIPADEVKPKSIKLLSNWEDSIPSIDYVIQLKPTAEEANSLGGVLQRMLSLPDRLIDLERRIIQAEQENENAAKLLVERQARNLDVLAEIEKVQQQINGFVPEESYQEKYTETEYVTEKVTKRERGSDGKSRDVETTERVPRKVTRYRTKFRYSRRQILAMEPLKAKILELQSEAQNNTNAIAFDEMIRQPFLEQILRRLDDEYFYLADPLELRDKQEKQSFEAELTRAIDEGGAGGMLYFARAVARTALGDYDGAQFDLNETNEVDSKYRALVQALEARVLLLKGNGDNAGSASKVLSRLKTELETDPRLRMLAARLEIDTKDYVSAAEHLELAAKLAPDECEIRHGLAWMLLSVPTVNSKRALQVATALVRMTAGRDWSSTAALAAAHSHGGKNELAIRSLDAAIESAPRHALNVCEKWRDQLHQKLPIKLDW
jgi:tetratricopeptide (TPR) repeat protein/S1-C subfamily serine protease